MKIKAEVILPDIYKAYKCHKCGTGFIFASAEEINYCPICAATCNSAISMFPTREELNFNPSHDI